MKAVLVLLLSTLISASAWCADTPCTCAIKFSATSTVHDFDGTVAAEPFTATLVNDGQAWAMEIDVKVLNMNTDNKKRDTDMCKMFDETKFPKIHGSISAAAIGAAKPTADGKPGSLPMTLTIRDVKHEIKTAVTGWHEDKGMVAFDMEFPVSLAAYKLPAPRMMFIKVGDEVRVRAHFSGLPLPAAAPAK